MLEMQLKTQKPLDTARHTLRDAGLIAFKNGLGRGITTEYTIIGLSDTAETPPEKGEKNNPFSGDVSKKPTKTPPEKGEKNNPNKGGTTIEEEKEESSAANAATPPPSSLSAKKSGASKPKKNAARADEVAALALPHPGPGFAQRWADFLASPKQAKKTLTALQLMLAKLGKYPEGFAVVMLEAAIQGDWQGVENDGTADKYAKWQAEQARRPSPVPTPPPAGFDPAALFGHTQTAAEGLAKARADPDYQRFLAEEAARQAPKPPNSP